MHDMHPVEAARQANRKVVRVFGICSECNQKVTSAHEDPGIPIKYTRYGRPLHPLTCEHVYMQKEKDY